MPALDNPAPGQSLRLDRALVYLRFVRTRSRAAALIEEGHLRINGQRAVRSSESVHIGDVLTIPLGKTVRLIEILALPQHRGPPGMARTHYQELDRDGESAIAPEQQSQFKGNAKP